MSLEKNSFQFSFASTIRALFKQTAKAFESEGMNITPEQHFILKILSSKEESIQSDLAEIMQKDKSAVMRHIDYLEKLGLLVRISDTIDRRKKHLVLTEKGNLTLEQCNDTIQKLTERNLSNISPEDLAAFNRVLSQLKQNAEK